MSPVFRSPTKSEFYLFGVSSFVWMLGQNLGEIGLFDFGKLFIDAITARQVRWSHSHFVQAFRKVRRTSAIRDFGFLLSCSWLWFLLGLFLFWVEEEPCRSECPLLGSFGFEHASIDEAW